MWFKSDWVALFNVFNELGQCHVSLQQHDASDKQATDNLEKQVEDLNKQVALVRSLSLKIS